MNRLTSLSEFYRSDIGKDIGNRVARVVSREVHDREALTIAVGFCDPIVDLLYFKNLFLAIPRGYPTTHWPRIRPFKTVAVDERRMPFLPETWDTIIVMHFVEFSTKNNSFLQEMHRILKTNGKLIVVCVNKNNMNFFSKGMASLHGVSHRKDDIIDRLLEEHFSVDAVVGVSEKFKFWPYWFSYRLNKFSEIFGEYSGLFSDIIVISTSKKEYATLGAVEKLNAQFDVT